MNVRKIVIVGGSILASALIIAGVTMVVVDKNKAKEIKNNTETVVNKYLSNIESGEASEAYKLVANSTKEWLSEEDFKMYIKVYTMEDKVNFEMDTSRQEAVTEEINAYLNKFYAYAEQSKDERLIKMKNTLSKREFIYMPVKRTYMSLVGGKKATVSDEVVLALVKGEKSYKIYFERQSFQNMKIRQYLKKAHNLTVEAMENITDTTVVNKNKEIILKCIGYAGTVDSEYYYCDRVNVYIQIFNAYVRLIEKKYEDAINTLIAAEQIATSTEDIIKIKQITSEVYLSQGLYSSAAETLKAAVAIDPDNDLLRASYRAVNRLMIDKIESSLSRGWNQLRSAISDTSNEYKRERNRILKNIAMPDADAVIKVKEDLPDGYFLKGSIYYCMGDFASARDYLEKALAKTSLEDVTFKTEVAQTLGLSKVSNQNTMDLYSYSQMNPGKVRSLFIRETNISGILDTMV